MPPVDYTVDCDSKPLWLLSEIDVIKNPQRFWRTLCAVAFCAC